MIDRLTSKMEIERKGILELVRLLNGDSVGTHLKAFRDILLSFLHEADIQEGEKDFEIGVSCLYQKKT